MRSSKQAQDSTEYVLPARRLAGSRAEVLAEIDALIQGLLGLRQLVARREQRRPVVDVARRLRLVPRSVVVPIVLCAVLLWAGPAAGQAPEGPAAAAGAAPETTDPNPGPLTLSGGIDFLNRYMFRGIRQHSTGVATWPWADVGVALYAGQGTVTSVGLNVGTWNSLHSGDTGSEGPSGKVWYESDFYTAASVGFAGGLSLTGTYTAYTSPNSSFSSVKELMVKLAVDDSAFLGRGGVKPYAIVAQELDAAPGQGQADGGLAAGTYLELGIAPGYAFGTASIGVPVKVGLSLSDYYELAGTDHTFGYFSVAAIVTVPVASPGRFGAWSIHGGVELQRLGGATSSFNDGDDTRVIASIGLGFAY